RIVKIWAAVAIAAIGFAGARSARSLARDREPAEYTAAPYAPSKASAPFISLGYHELAADVLFVRLRAHFGGVQDTGARMRSLCEAIVALDPKEHYTYEFCARAMTLAREGVDQSIFWRAIGLLETGIKEFPNEWRFPNLAGQIYTQDLVTDNPVLRRKWDER